MLYDGALTLDNSGQATITLDEPMEMGKQVTLTYEGIDYSGNVYLNSGTLTLTINMGSASDYFEIADDTASMVKNNVPVKGEVELKLTQYDLPELTDLYNNTLTLTAQQMGGQDVMAGAFEMSAWENTVIYAFIGDELKTATKDADIQWLDGESMNAIVQTGATSFAYVTTDLSLSSVDLRVAIPAS